MAGIDELHNRVRARRRDRGWSQLELAERAGISRTAVSAIEGHRLVPSVAAALALARALDCTVEELFGLAGRPASQPTWAWEPASVPCRYWQAEVAGRTLRYPVEPTSYSLIPHDGVLGRGIAESCDRDVTEETLVLACCDPAASLLANQLAVSTGFRLLVFSRSSRRAVDLLQQGLVHVAGLHLSTAEHPDRNREIVKARLGEEFHLVRAARWQEGLAVSPALAIKSVESAVRSKLRWVGREPGSGARQCLDELFAGRQPALRRMAHDHRGVADAVRSGWADAGVCLRLTSDEAGLTFMSVREEGYDLCFPAQSQQDPRIQALIRVLQSRTYRKLLGELPGYDTTQTGEEQ